MTGWRYRTLGLIDQNRDVCRIYQAFRIPQLRLEHPTSTQIWTYDWSFRNFPVEKWICDSKEDTLGQETSVTENILDQTERKHV